MTGISTPCVKLCAIDPQSGLCAGCARSLQEIAQWGALREDQRRAIMAQLPERQQKLTPSRSTKSENAR